MRLTMSATARHARSWLDRVRRFGAKRTVRFKMFPEIPKRTRIGMMVPMRTPSVEFTDRDICRSVRQMSVADFGGDIEEFDI